MIDRSKILRSLVVMALIAGLGVMPALPQTAAAQTPERISGTVTLPPPDAADAEVSAVAFQMVEGAWTAVAGENVAADGAYTIELPGPGTYRVGFFDAALVYADRFWLNQTAVTASQDVTVTAGANITNINQALIANPRNFIEGTVRFAGATGHPVGVELYRWTSLDGVFQWAPTHTRTTRPDGTYRIQTPGPAQGPYRLGFVDVTDTFGDVFFRNAKDIETADGVSVITTGTPVPSIDVTMTLLPSERVHGPDRFETAVALSKQGFDDGFGGSVVLSSGRSPFDGLSAGVFAYAAEGPLLLTEATSMPAATMNEILRLTPYEVIIVGGPASVSLSQEALLRGSVPVVRRLWGQDRYATAAQVAQEMVSRGLTGGESLEVFVASGETFADALALAPVAATAGRPILFVKAREVPVATREFFDTNTVGGVKVVGGTSRVSPAVAAELGAAEVDRLSGRDRYYTAAAIATYGIDKLGMSARVAGLASGAGFADALAAGPYLAGGTRVLLLTEPTGLSAGTREFLNGRKDSLARIIAVGGSGSVSEEVFTEALAAIQ